MPDDMNCTRYTKKPQKPTKKKTPKKNQGGQYHFGTSLCLNYTQLNAIFLRKIYKYFFFLCYRYTI